MGRTSVISRDAKMERDDSTPTLRLYLKERKPDDDPPPSPEPPQERFYKLVFKLVFFYLVHLVLNRD